MEEEEACAKKKKERIVGVELPKQRCKLLIDRIERLPCSTKITDSCKRTLLKLAQAELSFLSRSGSSSTSTPLSVNIGHLEAVLHILQQPFVTGVSRVCKSIPFLPSVSRKKNRNNSCSKHVHVDIVCTINRKPTWVLVSDRNPIYLSWNRCHKSKGLKLRLEEVLNAGKSTLTMRPSSVVLFFANGLGNHLLKKLEEEFGASEIRLEFAVFNLDLFEDVDGEWVNVLAKSYKQARILEIIPDDTKDAVPNSEYNMKGPCEGTVPLQLSDEKAEIGGTFQSIVSELNLCSGNIENRGSAQLGNLMGVDNLLNLDTTALIALVSGISNGGSKKLLSTPECELRQRFKGNFDFVIGQVISEIENPILVELGNILHRKMGIICESVHSEFKEIASMCGGPNEKIRADNLIKSLRVVPDCPSARIRSLPTTRKLALKNKVVFGTGDYWQAPTLTANMAFVRAISQTAMSLYTIEHRPRALIGD